MNDTGIDHEAEDHRRLLKLEQEQWRRQCRSSFLSFCIEALSPRGESPALHHRLIASELEAVARGKQKRLDDPGATRISQNDL
jgi:hypothetical protein